MGEQRADVTGDDLGGREGTVTLPDGRILGIVDTGDVDGAPMFYFHGHPGSRRDLRFVDPTGVVPGSGVRVIAVDRPGYGLSSPVPGRGLLDWAGDVNHLATLLGIDRFAVLGYSGGGPFAAATAYALPQRVTALLLVAAMGPPSAPGQKRWPGWALPGSPPPVRHALAAGLNVTSRVTPDRVAVAAMSASLPPADRVALSNPVVAQGLLGTWREAFRQGRGATVTDADIYTRRWPFSYGDIRPPTWLWHGTADVNVPVSVAEYAQARLPQPTSAFLPGEAHLSVWGQLPQMLAVARTVT